VNSSRPIAEVFAVNVFRKSMKMSWNLPKFSLIQAPHSRVVVSVGMQKHLYGLKLTKQSFKLEPIELLLLCLFVQKEYRTSNTIWNEKTNQPTMCN
jgi:hypothetical protein